jgi:fatty acid desaturase
MRLQDVLTQDEIRVLLRRSDLLAAWTLLVNWTLILGVLAWVAAWPHPVSVVVALLILGNRQLGLAVLMHDSGHRALFRSAALNRWVGRWLCGAPVFADLDTYAKKHLQHHRDAGSHDDPDLANYVNYAVPRASLVRKVLRDLSGRTGIKQLALTARFGGWRVLWRPLVAHGLLFGGAWWAGRPWLYLVWLGAWLSTNMLYSRLRNAAEHAVVPDLFDPDPRRHTRTTLARWWERLTLAPNHVNYHLEHHLLPSVPPYRLARLHRLLRERGFYEGAEIVEGYGRVIGKLTLSPGASVGPQPAISQP